MKETQSKKIVINDFRPEIIKILIDFLYTSKMEVNDDNVTELYHGK